MVAQPVAQSISQRVWRRLSNQGFAGEVGSTFRRACMVVDCDSQVVFLVLPDIGDGPLNIVLAAQPGVFAGVARGSPVRLDRNRLRLGQLQIQLKNPAIWDPRPNWNRLRATASPISAALPELIEFAAPLAPDSSLLALIARRGSDSQTAMPLNSILASTVHEAMQELKAGWGGRADHVHTGASRLAGLGTGLTPAGDDFLAGLMLWSWLAHPRPDRYCRQLLGAASPRTTRLARALLAVAAKGECSAPWHSLLEALAQRSKSRSQSAVRDVLAFGATSGADALAGFLFMGLETTCGAAPLTLRGERGPE
ncbi:DUF2877 domain-containing protein [Chloroflexota bacterium]